MHSLKLNALYHAIASNGLHALISEQQTCAALQDLALHFRTFCFMVGCNTDIGHILYASIARTSS